jgi:SAM-dependent methyltransferase
VQTYYREDLAHVHEAGYGFHAERCAPGILELLAPVLARRGTVLEVGCGSGQLTRRLIAAGHRVIATDASPAMLAIARARTQGAERIERLVLPDDPVPPADAVVAIGHVLNYLEDEAALRRALLALIRALRPGGLLAVDLQDLRWGESFAAVPNQGRAGDDWALISEFSVPQRDRFVRRMISFVREDGGLWRRDEETHRNVLVETAKLPGFLREHGADARIMDAFGSEVLPEGLVVVLARVPERA